jgi:predicted XRE-type DNA-binding protein
MCAGALPTMEATTERESVMKNNGTVKQGGRNVFEDLKLPNAEELNAKAQIAYRICDILEERKLTQKQAAAVLGIDQPKVSALLRGRLEGFSSDRLFRFLNALDREVEIVIRPVKKRSHTPGIRVLTTA